MHLKTISDRNQPNFQSPTWWQIHQRKWFTTMTMMTTVERVPVLMNILEQLRMVLVNKELSLQARVFSFRFSWNSEAYTWELQENLNEMKYSHVQWRFESEQIFHTALIICCLCWTKKVMSQNHNRIVFKYHNHFSDCSMIIWWEVEKV